MIIVSKSLVALEGPFRALLARGDVLEGAVTVKQSISTLPRLETGQINDSSSALTGKPRVSPML